MLSEINDYISYIPSCEDPISGDVGVIKGEKTTYLYDVGSTYECLDFLYSLKGKMQIIISHFHADHTWWLTKHRKGDKGLKEGDEISLTYERPEFEKLFIGKGGEKYLKDGIIVREKTVINDRTPSGLPLKLEIIPMPSSHTKDALALSVNDEYLFMGDSTYCAYVEKGETGERWAEYNVQKLKEQIDLLKNLKPENCILSHEKHIVRPKKVVIRQLEALYGKREPGNNFIKIQ
ncbi:MAG: MBL fold metallo-hydrolase [Lachnospiraceae bacterium]|nr:MBL fold metallo-hydrolase [Lachnospiraceae bacterium]